MLCLYKNIALIYLKDDTADRTAIDDAAKALNDPTEGLEKATLQDTKDADRGIFKQRIAKRKR